MFLGGDRWPILIVLFNALVVVGMFGACALIVKALFF